MGSRQWCLDHDDDLPAFVTIVCDSHWPGKPDCLPIQVQVGPFWEGAIPYREESISGRYGRSFESLGTLPQYNKYLITAEYQLQRMTNCWPTSIPKIWHPPGSTLSLRVRGSGQYLLVSPAGMRAAGQLLLCDETNTAALSRSVATRIILPTAEYAITCGRLTKDQLDLIVWDGRLDTMLGCVNHGPEYGSPGSETMDSCINFLGAARGTMLFDGYEIHEMCVCSYTSHLRYALTATFKKRVITDDWAMPRLDADGRYIGWNHDFVAIEGERKWGWTYIKMWDEGVCRSRYPFVDFGQLLTGGSPCTSQSCSTQGAPHTYLRDNQLCRPWV